MPKFKVGQKVMYCIKRETVNEKFKYHFSPDQYGFIESVDTYPARRYDGTVEGIYARYKLKNEAGEIIVGKEGWEKIFLEEELLRFKTEEEIACEKAVEEELQAIEEERLRKKQAEEQLPEINKSLKLIAEYLKVIADHLERGDSNGNKM